MPSLPWTIEWDFDSLTMSFRWKDQQVIYKGKVTTPFGAHVCHCTIGIMTTILFEFEAIFAKPMGLAPSCDCNHCIHLLPMKEIRDMLLQAQQAMKKQHDTFHCDLEFALRGWVWLRLHIS